MRNSHVHESVYACVRARPRALLRVCACVRMHAVCVHAVRACMRVRARVFFVLQLRSAELPSCSLPDLQVRSDPDTHARVRNYPHLRTRLRDILWPI